MFAFLGLGIQEILILAAVAALIVVPVVIVLVVIRSSAGPSRQVAELEEENRRLRSELDRDNPPPV